MSKSILAIDAPEDCERCPFCRGWNVCMLMKCLKREGIISTYILDTWILEGGKPDWCPLCDFPEKLDENIEDYEESYYIGGWNDCIEEILKGANKND